MATTIREIAKLAGVSPATVSRVLNGTAKVQPDKEKRVREVIEMTGFKPNEMARFLFNKQSKIIGLIVPNVENPFFTQMLKAVEEEAYQKGFRIMFCNSDNNPQKEIVNIEILSGLNAIGIILLTSHDDSYKVVEESSIPVVVLDRELNSEHCISSIIADHYMGGRLAVQHLIDCGCKHMVHLQGPQDVSSGRERFRGYVDVCIESGIVPRYVEGSYRFGLGMDAAEKLLELYPDTDGIIVPNDLAAMAVYKVLNRMGKKVPDDVQVVGYDNVDLSTMMTPELTTIEQPIEEMGKQAVQTLLRFVEEHEVERICDFQVKLIERESTIK